MAGMPFQAHPRRERVWADSDMSAILTIKGLVWGGTFWCLFLAVEKKTLAHLLNSGYEARKALVCEILFRLYENGAMPFGYCTLQIYKVEKASVCESNIN